MRVKSFSYEKFYFKFRISLKLIILISSLLFFLREIKNYINWYITNYIIPFKKAKFIFIDLYDLYHM